MAFNVPDVVVEYLGRKWFKRKLRVDFDMEVDVSRLEKISSKEFAWTRINQEYLLEALSLVKELKPHKGVQLTICNGGILKITFEVISEKDLKEHEITILIAPMKVTE